MMWQNTRKRFLATGGSVAASRRLLAANRWQRKDSRIMIHAEADRAREVPTVNLSTDLVIVGARRNLRRDYGGARRISRRPHSGPACGGRQRFERGSALDSRRHRAHGQQ
jgi:hypothetical protein